MLTLVEQLKETTQLRWNKVHKFRAKINFHLDAGPYLIKTATSQAELMESFKLRDAVFNREFRGLEQEGLDFDKFDYYFDHLIIVHKETNKIIGTYRLSCSTFSKKSYTALEFNLRSLQLMKSPYLELGRACIHQDYRKGAVISLLWRGIAEYMVKCEAQTLFGCSSVKINHSREAALLYRYLQLQGHVEESYLSYPTAPFKMKNFDSWFTVLKREDLSKSLARKFQIN